MRKPSCDIKDLNKGAWSKQEDQKLVDYIKKHGEVCWRTLPQAAGIYDFFLSININLLVFVKNIN